MKNEKKYVWKDIIICCTLFAFPIFLLEAIFALLDINSVEFNAKKYSGIKGFVIPFIYLAFFGIFFGTFNYIMLSIGNFFKNKLKL